MSPTRTSLLIAACLTFVSSPAFSAEGPAKTPEISPIQKSIQSANPLKYNTILPVQGKTADFQITHKNPTAGPLTVTLTWNTPADSPWKIEPASQTLTLSPGQSASTNHKATFTQRADLYAAPLPQLDITYAAPDKPEPIAAQSSPLKADLPGYYQGKMVAFATKTAKPPVIDGKLDDPAWAACIPTSHFVSKSAAARAPWTTDVRVCWDDQAVYICARMAEPDLANLYARIKDRNDKVWTDDSFEAIFDFDASKYGFAQFMVNPNNVPYDTFGKRVRWDTVWTSQTGREKDAWTAEMAIPWAAMESPPPKPNEKIRFQLVRNRVRDDKHTHWQWAPTFVHGNRIPAKFGSLLFIDPGPAAMPAALVPPGSTPASAPGPAAEGQAGGSMPAKPKP